MHQRVLIAGAGLCLVVGFAAGCPLEQKHSEQMSARTGISSSERRATDLDCDHPLEAIGTPSASLITSQSRRSTLQIGRSVKESPQSSGSVSQMQISKKCSSNSKMTSCLRVEKLDLLDNHAPQLLVLTASAGTGDDIDWHVISESNGALVEWKPQDYEGPAEKLLRSDEDFCCKDWNFHIQGNEIVLARGIYRKGEANCCPSREACPSPAQRQFVQPC